MLIVTGVGERGHKCPTELGAVGTSLPCAAQGCRGGRGELRGQTSCGHECSTLGTPTQRGTLRPQGGHRPRHGHRRLRQGTSTI